MITADVIRGLIIAQDAARPRSQQRTIGPSDLSSPCDRKIGYQILGVPPVTQSEVNGYAWVGTGIHRQMESACEHDNSQSDQSGRWLTEVPVAVPVTDTVTLRGHADAYNIPSRTVVDWKSRGANKPSAATRAKHHTQLLPYALGLILAGYTVEHCAVVYIARNGTLDDIEVDARPFDHAAADRLLSRYSNLLTAAAIGTPVLPLLGTADDCTYCPYWAPGADTLTAACPGHQKPPGGDLPPWEIQEEEQEKEGART